MTRDEIIAGLMTRGAERAPAVTYADAYLEYHAACEKIVRYGFLIGPPVTGCATTISVRNAARARLRMMFVGSGVDVGWLW